LGRSDRACEDAGGVAESAEPAATSSGSADNPQGAEPAAAFGSAGRIAESAEPAAISSSAGRQTESATGKPGPRRLGRPEKADGGEATLTRLIYGQSTKSTV